MTSNAAENKSSRASSPAGDRSSTSASNGARRVPGAPAGRMSSVMRRTESVCQGEVSSHVPSHAWSESQSQRMRRGRRSTTCSARGRPCASVARANLACARTDPDVARVRKASSKEVRRGLARTRRVPHVGRASSPGEGTMRRARVRSWPRGRMRRANVSCLAEST
jgi:hypothetical protein